MTQEDKELLLKDLSARLPYSVKVFYEYVDYLDKKTYGYSLTLSTWCIDELVAEKAIIKSYLRPISSMTEEEINELKKLCTFYIPSDSKTIGFEDYGILVVTHHITDNTHSFKLNIQVIDWLNKHHFDYRGLIKKGLAIEAPKGMYNLK